jgi:glycosyltransferase involved in cell wall biosynthesis
MKNKKILFVAGASYVSGLENITLHLIREVKAQGYDARCIISGWNDGVFKGQLTELGVPFYELKLGWFYLKHPSWTLDALRHWRPAYTQFRQVLNEFDPDIIHFTNYAAPLMVYPLLKGRKCLYALHETHLPTRKHLFIYRLLNRRVKIFTAVSGHIVNVLAALKIPRDKIRLVYNGVPVSPASPAADAQEVRIGIVGQIADWKGHDTLVDAVEKLTADPRPAPFKVGIYGNDKTPYAEMLKQRIKDKELGAYFTWHGFVKDQEMIYSSLDIVAVPSLSEEPCSLTLLETMMRGKAIIVSARGGNTELVDDGVNGKVFKAGDAGELTGCIRLLVEDRGLAGNYGKKAREKALREFTISRMVDQYVEIYQRM